MGRVTEPTLQFKTVAWWGVFLHETEVVQVAHWVVDIVDCSGHLEATGSALSSMTVVCVVQGYASWRCTVFDYVHMLRTSCRVS